MSEVASADPAVKKAAVASLSALSEADVRKMCVDRDIEVTHLKSKAIMNIAIIEHEEASLRYWRMRWIRQSMTR